MITIVPERTPVLIETLTRLWENRYKPVITFSPNRIFADLSLLSKKVSPK